MDLGGQFQPARSIPNLPNNTCTSMVPKSDSFHMARSSSQPPEMWGRDEQENNPDSDRYSDKRINLVTSGTQTDGKVEISLIEGFILANPRLVLNLLGIDPPYHVDCDILQYPPPPSQSLVPIPETSISSPDLIPSPNGTEFIFEDNLYNMSSPKNSCHNHAENSGSMDALLDDSSDDQVKSDDDNGSNTVEGGAVNFNIIRECSFKSLKKSRSTERKMDKSSSMETETAANTTNPFSRSNSTRRSSWKESNINIKKHCDAGSSPPTIVQSEYTNTDDKSALLQNDRLSKNDRDLSANMEFYKRHHQLTPRAPVSYRFSAGDADKLEKGIKTVPSTRSLKDS